MGSFLQRSRVGSGMRFAAAPRNVARRHMGVSVGPRLWGSRYQASVGSSQTGQTGGHLVGSYFVSQHWS